jgi:hypothetical protein
VPPLMLALSVQANIFHTDRANVGLFMCLESN